MKKVMLVSGVIMALSIASAQEHSLKEDLIRVKDDVAVDIKEGWNVSKDKVSELSKDAKNGLEKTSDSIKNKIDSLHSTYQVSDAASLNKYLTVEILDTQVVENNELAISVLLKNATDKPVKFDEIMGKTDIIVLNAEQLAHFATDDTYKNSKELVIPANSSIKTSWMFKDANSKPITLRLFDVNYSLVKDSL